LIWDTNILVYGGNILKPSLVVNFLLSFFLLLGGGQSQMPRKYATGLILFTVGVSKGDKYIKPQNNKRSLL